MPLAKSLVKGPLPLSVAASTRISTTSRLVRSLVLRAQGHLPAPLLLSLQRLIPRRRHRHPTLRPVSTTTLTPTTILSVRVPVREFTTAKRPQETKIDSRMHLSTAVTANRPRVVAKILRASGLAVNKNLIRSLVKSPRPHSVAASTRIFTPVSAMVLPKEPLVCSIAMGKGWERAPKWPQI